MRFLHTLKESLVATLLVVLTTFIVKLIPFNNEFRKAIFQGFSDFDIYDLKFSGKQAGNNKYDSNIVIVGIGGSREAIAKQIEIISKYEPKVIGVDAFFDGPKSELEDFIFTESIRDKSNIIFASRFVDTPHARMIPTFFSKNESQNGFANLIGNNYTVARTYPPFIKIGETKYEAFTTSIMRLFDSSYYERLKHRNNKQELINYTGNLESYTNISTNELNYFDSTRQLEDIIKGKIVLLGFFVKQDSVHNVPLILEDLHYSPVNPRVSGRSFPDMYGVVIHANILTMLLHPAKYATLVSNTTAYIIAFLLAWFFHYYMLSRYFKRVHPSHGKFMLILLLGVLLITWIFLQVFNIFLIKVPLEQTMIALVLSLEMIGLYRNIALWMHRKFHYQTVFTHQHVI